MRTSSRMRLLLPAAGVFALLLLLTMVSAEPREQFVFRLLSVYASGPDHVTAADRDNNDQISDTELLQSLFFFTDSERDRKVTQAEFVDGYRRQFGLPAELLVIMFDLLDDLNDDSAGRGPSSSEGSSARDSRNNEFFDKFSQMSPSGDIFADNYQRQGDGVLTTQDVSLRKFLGEGGKANKEEYRKSLMKWVGAAAERLYTINYQPHIPGDPWDLEFDYEQWFHNVDRNNDSLVSFQELREEFLRYGHDGRVSRSQWTERNLQEYGDREWLANVVFDYWDKTKDLRLDDVDMALILKEADRNHDMQVTTIEFHRFMEKYNKRARRRMATPIRPVVYDCPSPWWQSFGCRPRVDATRAAMDMDDNFDGWITQGELRKRVSYYDRNGDGWASRMEVMMVESMRYGVSGPVASIMFDVYDRNGDGRYDLSDLHGMLEGGRVLCFCDARRAVMDLARLAEKFKNSPEAQGSPDALRDSMRWHMTREWRWRRQTEQVWRRVWGEGAGPGGATCREGDCTGKDWRGGAWYSPFDWRQKNRVPENFLQWSYLRNIPRTVTFPQPTFGLGASPEGLYAGAGRNWWNPQWSGRDGSSYLGGNQGMPNQVYPGLADDSSASETGLNFPLRGPRLEIPDSGFFPSGSEGAFMPRDFLPNPTRINNSPGRLPPSMPGGLSPEALWPKQGHIDDMWDNMFEDGGNNTAVDPQWPSSYPSYKPGQVFPGFPQQPGKTQGFFGTGGQLMGSDDNPDVQINNAHDAHQHSNPNNRDGFETAGGSNMFSSMNNNKQNNNGLINNPLFGTRFKRQVKTTTEANKVLDKSSVTKTSPTLVTPAPATVAILGSTETKSSSSTENNSSQTTAEAKNDTIKKVENSLTDRTDFDKPNAAYVKNNDDIKNTVARSKNPFLKSNWMDEDGERNCDDGVSSPFNTEWDNTWRSVPNNFGFMPSSSTDPSWPSSQSLPPWNGNAPAYQWNPYNNFQPQHHMFPNTWGQDIQNKLYGNNPSSIFYQRDQNDKSENDHYLAKRNAKEVPETSTAAEETSRWVRDSFSPFLNRFNSYGNDAYNSMNKIYQPGGWNNQNPLQDEINVSFNQLGRNYYSTPFMYSWPFNSLTSFNQRKPNIGLNGIYRFPMSYIGGFSSPHSLFKRSIDTADHETKDEAGQKDQVANQMAGSNFHGPYAPQILSSVNKQSPYRNLFSNSYDNQYDGFRYGLDNMNGIYGDDYLFSDLSDHRRFNHFSFYQPQWWNEWQRHKEIWRPEHNQWSAEQFWDLQKTNERFVPGYFPQRRSYNVPFLIDGQHPVVRRSSDQTKPKETKDKVSNMINGYWPQWWNSWNNLRYWPQYWDDWEWNSNWDRSWKMNIGLWNKWMWSSYQYYPFMFSGDGSVNEQVRSKRSTDASKTDDVISRMTSGYSGHWPQWWNMWNNDPFWPSDWNKRQWNYQWSWPMDINNGYSNSWKWNNYQNYPFMFSRDTSVNAGMRYKRSTDSSEDISTMMGEYSGYWPQWWNKWNQNGYRDNWPQSWNNWYGNNWNWGNSNWVDWMMNQNQVWRKWMWSNDQNYPFLFSKQNNKEEPSREKRSTDGQNEQNTVSRMTMGYNGYWPQWWNMWNNDQYWPSNWFHANQNYQWNWPKSWGINDWYWNRWMWNNFQYYPIMFSKDTKENENMRDKRSIKATEDSDNVSRMMGGYSGNWPQWWNTWNTYRYWPQSLDNWNGNNWNRRMDSIWNRNQNNWMGGNNQHYPFMFSEDSNIKDHAREKRRTGNDQDKVYQMTSSYQPSFWNNPRDWPQYWNSWNWNNDWMWSKYQHFPFTYSKNSKINEEERSKRSTYKAENSDEISKMLGRYSGYWPQWWNSWTSNRYWPKPWNSWFGNNWNWDNRDWDRWGMNANWYWENWMWRNYQYYPFLFTNQDNKEEFLREKRSADGQDEKDSVSRMTMGHSGYWPQWWNMWNNDPYWQSDWFNGNWNYEMSRPRNWGVNDWYWNSWMWNNYQYYPFMFSQDSKVNANMRSKRSTDATEDNDNVSRMMGGYSGYWPQWWNTWSSYKNWASDWSNGNWNFQMFRPKNWGVNDWYWNSWMWNNYQYYPFMFSQDSKINEIMRSKRSTDATEDIDNVSRMMGGHSGYWPQWWNTWSSYKNRPSDWSNGNWNYQMFRPRDWGVNDWYWNSWMSNKYQYYPFMFSQDTKVNENMRSKRSTDAKENIDNVSRMMGGYSGFWPQWWNAWTSNRYWPQSWNSQSGNNWNWGSRNWDRWGMNANWYWENWMWRNYQYYPFLFTNHDDKEELLREKRSADGQDEKDSVSRMTMGHSGYWPQWWNMWNNDQYWPSDWFSSNWNYQMFWPRNWGVNDWYWNSWMWNNYQYYPFMFSQDSKVNENMRSKRSTDAKEDIDNVSRMMGGYSGYWPQWWNTWSSYKNWPSDWFNGNWNYQMFWPRNWGVNDLYWNSWMWNNYQYYPFMFSQDTKVNENMRNKRSIKDSDNVSRMMGGYSGYWPQWWNTWSVYRNWPKSWNNWNSGNWNWDSGAQNPYWNRNDLMWRNYQYYPFMFSSVGSLNEPNRHKRSSDATTNSEEISRMMNSYGGYRPQSWNNWNWNNRNWANWNWNSWTRDTNSYWNNWMWSNFQQYPFFFSNQDKREEHRKEKRSTNESKKKEEFSRMNNGINGYWPHGQNAWSNNPYWSSKWNYWNWNNYGLRPLSSNTDSEHWNSWIQNDYQFDPMMFSKDIVLNDIMRKKRSTDETKNTDDIAKRVSGFNGFWPQGWNTWNNYRNWPQYWDNWMWNNYQYYPFHFFKDINKTELLREKRSANDSLEEKVVSKMMNTNWPQWSNMWDFNSYWPSQWNNQDWNNQWPWSERRYMNRWMWNNFHYYPFMFAKDNSVNDYIRNKRNTKTSDDVSRMTDTFTEPWPQWWNSWNSYRYWPQSWNNWNNNWPDGQNIWSHYWPTRNNDKGMYWDNMNRMLFQPSQFFLKGNTADEFVRQKRSTSEQTQEKVSKMMDINKGYLPQWRNMWNSYRYWPQYWNNWNWDNWMWSRYFPFYFRYGEKQQDERVRTKRSDENQKEDKTSNMNGGFGRYWPQWWNTRNHYWPLFWGNRNMHWHGRNLNNDWMWKDGWNSGFQNDEQPTNTESHENLHIFTKRSAHLPAEYLKRTKKENEDQAEISRMMHSYSENWPQSWNMWRNNRNWPQYLDWNNAQWSSQNRYWPQNNDYYLHSYSVKDQTHDKEHFVSKRSSDNKHEDRTANMMNGFNGYWPQWSNSNSYWPWYWNNYNWMWTGYQNFPHFSFSMKNQFMREKRSTKLSNENDDHKTSSQMMQPYESFWPQWWNQLGDSRYWPQSWNNYWKYSPDMYNRMWSNYNLFDFALSRHAKSNELKMMRKKRSSDTPQDSLGSETSNEKESSDSEKAKTDPDIARQLNRYSGYPGNIYEQQWLRLYKHYMNRSPRYWKTEYITDDFDRYSPRSPAWNQMANWYKRYYIKYNVPWDDLQGWHKPRWEDTQREKNWFINDVFKDQPDWRYLSSFISGSENYPFTSHQKKSPESPDLQMLDNKVSSINKSKRSADGMLNHGYFPQLMASPGNYYNGFGLGNPWLVLRTGNKQWPWRDWQSYWPSGKLDNSLSGYNSMWPYLNNYPFSFSQKETDIQQNIRAQQESLQAESDSGGDKTKDKQVNRMKRSIEEEEEDEEEEEEESKISADSDLYVSRWQNPFYSVFRQPTEQTAYYNIPVENWNSYMLEWNNQLPNWYRDMQNRKTLLPSGNGQNWMNGFRGSTEQQNLRPLDISWLNRNFMHSPWNMDRQTMDGYWNKGRPFQFSFSKKDDSKNENNSKEQAHGNKKRSVDLGLDNSSRKVSQWKADMFSKSPFMMGMPWPYFSPTWKSRGFASREMPWNGWRTSNPGNMGYNNNIQNDFSFLYSSKEQNENLVTDRQKRSTGEESSNTESKASSASQASSADNKEQQDRKEDDAEVSRMREALMPMSMFPRNWPVPSSYFNHGSWIKNSWPLYPQSSLKMYDVEPFWYQKQYYPQWYSDWYNPKWDQNWYNNKWNELWYGARRNPTWKMGQFDQFPHYPDKIVSEKGNYDQRWGNGNKFNNDYSNSYLDESVHDPLSSFYFAKKEETTEDNVKKELDKSTAAEAQSQEEGKLNADNKLNRNVNTKSKRSTVNIENILKQRLQQRNLLKRVKTRESTAEQETPSKLKRFSPEAKQRLQLRFQKLHKRNAKAASTSESKEAKPESAKATAKATAPGQVNNMGRDREWGPAGRSGFPKPAGTGQIPKQAFPESKPNINQGQSWNSGSGQSQNWNPASSQGQSWNPDMGQGQSQYGSGQTSWQGSKDWAGTQGSGSGSGPGSGIGSGYGQAGLPTSGTASPGGLGITKGTAGGSVFPNLGGAGQSGPDLRNTDRTDPNTLTPQFFNPASVNTSGRPLANTTDWNKLFGLWAYGPNFWNDLDDLDLWDSTGDQTPFGTASGWSPMGPTGWLKKVGIPTEVGWETVWVDDCHHNRYPPSPFRRGGRLEGVPWWSADPAGSNGVPSPWRSRFQYNTAFSAAASARSDDIRVRRSAAAASSSGSVGDGSGFPGSGFAEPQPSPNSVDDGHGSTPGSPSLDNTNMAPDLSFPFPGGPAFQGPEAVAFLPSYSGSGWESGLPWWDTNNWYVRGQDASPSFTGGPSVGVGGWFPGGEDDTDFQGPDGLVPGYPGPDAGDVYRGGFGGWRPDFPGMGDAGLGQRLFPDPVGFVGPRGFPAADRGSGMGGPAWQPPSPPAAAAGHGFPRKAAPFPGAQRPGPWGRTGGGDLFRAHPGFLHHGPLRQEAGRPEGGPDRARSEATLAAGSGSRFEGSAGAAGSRSERAADTKLTQPGQDGSLTEPPSPWNLNPWNKNRHGFGGENNHGGHHRNTNDQGSSRTDNQIGNGGSRKDTRKGPLFGKYLPKTRE